MASIGSKPLASAASDGARATKISSSTPSAGIPWVRGTSSASSQPGVLASPRTRMMSITGGCALRITSTLVMRSTGARVAWSSGAPLTGGTSIGGEPVRCACSGLGPGACAAARPQRPDRAMRAAAAVIFLAVMVALSREPSMLPCRGTAWRHPVVVFQALGAGARKLAAAPPEVRQEGRCVVVLDAALDLLEGGENQIRRHYLRQGAERGARALEAAVLRQFVDRGAAAAGREVLALAPADIDPGGNVA